MKKQRKTWLSTSQASKTLQRPRSWLLGRIRSGTFRLGVHYRNISDGLRPTYEFCLEAIDDFYSEK